MRESDIERLSPEEFVRLTGVKPEIFRRMAAIIQEDENARRLNGGPKKRLLSIEGRVLMMLEYWREYRTYFHIAQSRGISESQTYKIIRRCEDVLAASGQFRLPGRKALAGERGELILIDATETPVERPKKSSGGGIRERRSATRSRRSLS